MCMLFCDKFQVQCYVQTLLAAVGPLAWSSSIKEMEIVTSQTFLSATDTPHKYEFVLLLGSSLIIMRDKQTHNYN